VVEPPLTPDDPRLEGWYHSIELAPGVSAQGVYDHAPVLDQYGFPASLSGTRALDVGSSDGFFAFELEARGASEVVAYDLQRMEDGDWFSAGPGPSGEQPFSSRIDLAIAERGSAIRRIPGSVYDLDPATAGMFDLVFCGSLLLHLQNPLGALARLRSVTTGLAIVETALDPELERLHPDEPLLRFGSRAHEEAHGLALGSAVTFWRMNGCALAELMEHAGFGTVELKPTFELPPTGHPVVVAHGRP
jgi:tRNA (mo5U34)-methyltransferase